MSGVFSGRFLWVLDTDKCGGLDKVVSVAENVGYGVLAKYHDGNPADDAKYGFREKFSQLVTACGKRNIPLAAWGYCYGDAYGHLDKEALAAVEALKSGALGYVIDAESEWEVRGSDRWAARFMQTVLSKVPGAEVAVTTFWNLRWHGSFPAKALWVNGCSVAIPQVYYWTAKRSGLEARRTMHTICDEDFRAAGYSSVCPAGELSNDITDTLDFLEIVGDKPHSFWLLDGYQDSPCLRVLRLAGRPCHPPATQVPASPAILRPRTGSRSNL